ncbi:hypothetical protein T5B8_03736 [Salinisphaera sp. T5B8]|uniref:hypothetical protein n=1 Tax=Salinisphaera sp. T5B8 TaxID=1304154 RepID=UPI00333FAB84
MNKLAGLALAILALLLVPSIAGSRDYDEAELHRIGEDLKFALTCGGDFDLTFGPDEICISSVWIQDDANAIFIGFELKSESEFERIADTMDHEVALGLIYRSLLKQERNLLRSNAISGDTKAWIRQAGGLKRTTISLTYPRGDEIVWIIRTDQGQCGYIVRPASDFYNPESH